MFRALYTRHFCRLHTLAVTGLPSPSLPNLCATFEGVLQEVNNIPARHLPAGKAFLVFRSLRETSSLLGYLPQEIGSEHL